MSFIERILFKFFNIKEEKQETPNTISKIIWEVGFNLTEEQRKKSRFTPFYSSIPELTVESIGGIPNVGEYLTFKYSLGIDNYGMEDFLFVILPPMYYSEYNLLGKYQFLLSDMEIRENIPYNH